MLKGKITPEQIEEIKSAIDAPIYKWSTKKKDHDVVFMALTHEAYERIQTRIKEASQAERERNSFLEDVNQFIFDQCVVWPPLDMMEKKNLPVGILPSVVKSILEQSGFISIDIMGNVIGPDVHTVQLKEFSYWDPPTQEKIDELKSKTTMPLYKTRIDKYFFIIRPMVRSDIQAASSSVDDQMSLVKDVTVWPESVDWGKIPTGVIEAIGREANAVSGWNLNDIEVEEL